MNSWIRYGLIIFACAVLLAGVARTDDNSGISDGPSRSELFEARMRADMGPAYNPLSTAARPAFYLPSDMKGELIFGIDVSHHNDENCKCPTGQVCTACKINWSRAASQQVSFVYAKATQGTRYRDPTFEYHWRTLGEHKIVRGAYHFMSADEDPIAQAENLLEKMEISGKLLPTDLPPCLDLEADIRKDRGKWFVTEDGSIRDFWLGQDPDDIIQKVLKWLKHVEEKTGRTPIIYTSRGWWNDRIKDEKKFALLKRYPIWIANYTDSGSHLNARPKVPNDHTWTLWQFTETGRMTDVDFLPGRLDVNIFNGSLGKFEEALGVTVPEAKEVATREEPKDKNKPAEQTAEAKPNAPSDSSKPAGESADATPSAPADAAKPPEHRAASDPATPTDVTKPPEQAATINPAAPADANKPREQTAEATPSALPDASKPPESVADAKPSEQTANVTPAAPSEATKPSEQTAAETPAPPADTSKPPEQVAVTNPAPPGDTNNKPSEQAASTNPAEPKDTGKPSEQVAALTPVAPKGDEPPPSQQAASSPSEPSQAAAPSSSRPSRSRARSSAQRTAEANTSAEAAPAEKPMMIEIVLLNGRVLRVDANINLDTLARLLTAVDKN